MARRGWLDERIDVLLAELNRGGLTVSREAAGTLLREQVTRIAAQAGVSEPTARRYLDDRAISGIAARMAEMLADERPGADPLGLPRTVRLPPATLGRLIAGLSEAIQVHLRNEPPDTAATHITNLAQLLSTLGELTAQADPRTRSGDPAAGVPMPPALLRRAARYLDAAAALIADGAVLPGDLDAEQASSLAAAFRRDGTRLRTLAGTDQRIPH